MAWRGVRTLKKKKKKTPSLNYFHHRFPGLFFHCLVERLRKNPQGCVCVVVVWWCGWVQRRDRGLGCNAGSQASSMSLNIYFRLAAFAEYLLFGQDRMRQWCGLRAVMGAEGTTLPCPW